MLFSRAIPIVNCFPPVLLTKVNGALPKFMFWYILMATTAIAMGAHINKHCWELKWEAQEKMSKNLVSNHTFENCCELCQMYLCACCAHVKLIVRKEIYDLEVCALTKTLFNLYHYALTCYRCYTSSWMDTFCCWYLWYTSSTNVCDRRVSSLSLALYHRMTKPSRADDTTANTSVLR